MRRSFASLPPTVLLELAALTLLALLLVTLWVQPAPAQQSGILDTTRLIEKLFDPTYRETQLEHERLSGVIYPVKTGMERYGHIPTWNPYISSGEPIINDAFSYLLNPFHSLPVLLTDSYIQGTKLAMFIALLIAAINMWALAWAVGIGAVGRVFAGVLYMTSGGIAGKFIAGHFQLALSLAWPPLVLAALWWTMRSRSRLGPVAFGITFALLFFAGNIYYVLPTLIGCTLIVLFHLFDHSPGATEEKSRRFYLPQHLTIRWDRLRRAVIAAAFAFGLAGVQFVPIWMTRDYVVHDNQEINPDGTLANSYSLNQAFVNFTYPWEQWSQLPIPFTQAVAVDYAYIGVTPFILIALALAALLTVSGIQNHTHQFRRIIWIALMLALVMTVWGSGQSTLLQFLYQHIPLLSEFRFLGRILTVAAMWWILLAAISVDILWRATYQALEPGLEFVRANRARLVRAMFLALLAWGYFLVYSLANTSTRLVMVLSDVHLLFAFDHRRFTSFTQVMESLWTFILIAVALDTLFIFVGALVKRWSSSFVLEWRGAGARILQMAVLAVVFTGIADTMLANSQLYQFETLPADFSVFFPTILANDTDTPFPAVSQPYAPSAYTAYDAELRNWGIDEGWKPAAVEGIISWAAGGLTDLPRWAIVSGAYGGSSLDLSKKFVAANGYEQRQCAFINPYALTDDPCDLKSSSTAILYEKPDVLPYAFVTTAEALTTAPAALNASNVSPAHVITHQLDTITIEAETPDNQPYFLVVQEIHFPGWQVTADGIPLQVTTAETYHDVNGSRGFLAVPMQPGAHTYSLHFEPPGLTTGLLISLITLVTIGFYLARGQKNGDELPHPSD